MVLPLQVKVDLGVITMKGYSTFSRTHTWALAQIEMQIAFFFQNLNLIYQFYFLW